MRRRFLSFLVVVFVLSGFLPGCSGVSQMKHPKAQLLGVSQDGLSAELLIPQLSPCNDLGEQSISIDRKAPLTLLVHGCWSSAGKFTTLSEVFAFHNQQTVCFNYDDRASMDESAKQLRLSLDALFRLTEIPEITIIGHSQGGLVSRRAFSTASEWSLKKENLSLVTISSPFAGIDASAHCGSTLATYLTLGMSKGICYLITGDKWDEIHPKANFIREPGPLVDGLSFHLKIVTNEEDSCRTISKDGFCIEDDFVFTLDEQYLDVIDNDAKVHNVEIKEGHVAVIGSEERPPEKLIQVLQNSGVLAETPKSRAAAFAQILTKLF